MTVVDEIGRSKYVSLTTFRKNGTAVATPVWHVVFKDEAHNLWGSVANNNYFFYVQTQFIRQYLLN